jgi:hypothetical protein
MLISTFSDDDCINTLEEILKVLFLPLFSIIVSVLVPCVATISDYYSRLTLDWIESLRTSQTCKLECVPAREVEVGILTIQNKSRLLASVDVTKHLQWFRGEIFVFSSEEA